jgi:putative phosphoribosyl transferase
MNRFLDRTDAGKQLAHKLEFLQGQRNVIVLGLPRGGVPVAFEIAKALAVPLGVLVVRKLGVPGHEELAMGAIASGGVRVLNDDIIQSLALDNETIDSEVAKERLELEQRETRYRGTKPFPSLTGKTVLVVDDGIATGATMRVAVKALKQHQPARIIVVAPTCARDTYQTLYREADEVICLATPEPYIAVGLWYEHFPQTRDEEVRSLLEQATRLSARPKREGDWYDNP